MKAFNLRLLYFYLILFSTGLMLSSCEAIEGIFKTGFWAGVGVMLLVVGFVVYIIFRSRSNR